MGCTMLSMGTRDNQFVEPLEHAWTCCETWLAQLSHARAPSFAMLHVKHACILLGSTPDLVLLLSHACYQSQ